MFKLAVVALLAMTASAASVDSSEAIWAEIDAEAEIELDMEKEPTAAQIMKFFDKNGNGAISKKEFFGGLMKIAKMHNYKPTKKDKEMASKLFDKADQDGSGEVDMKELKAAIAWCKKNLK